MTNNDILRRFRYALDISNPKMLEIFRLAGRELDQAALVSLLKKEEDEGFQPCGNGLLEAFLDGLIILKRQPGTSQRSSQQTSTRIGFRIGLGDR